MHAYAPPELSEPAITRIRFVAIACLVGKLIVSQGLDCGESKVPFSGPAIWN
jgi:hypothetical protein